MKHLASSSFWALYQALPEQARRLADKSYELLKANPHHPSLHLKRIGELWSVRIGEHHRALGTDAEGDIIWFWIGTHADYDRMVRS